MALILAIAIFLLTSDFFSIVLYMTPFSLWKASHQPPSLTKAHAPSKRGQLATNKMR
jgi:hypothetical protein